MKKLGKKTLSFLCAVCMLSSSVGDMSVLAARVPFVLTKELVASDDETYEITVRYEVEVPDDWDEKRDGSYLDTLHVDLAVREILEPAPTEETAAPAEETAAPAEELEVPAEETEAPAEETEAPAEETEAPAEETEAPAEATEAPTEETEAPAEAPEAPAEATEAPTEAPEAPAEAPEAPAEAPEAPAEEPAAPAEENETPTEEPEAPAEEPTVPAEESAAPAEEPEEPAEESEYPYTYYEYIQKSAEALDYNPWELKTARVFDISLIDTLTGEEIQPDSSVGVSIRLLSEPLDPDSDIGVVHFGEVAPEVMDASVNGEAVEFETESFSVYVVISHEGSATVTEPRIEFHFIDSEYHDSSEAGYESLAAGTYQSAPYSFPNKNNSEQTTQILKSGETLELVKNPENISVVEYQKTTDTVIKPTTTYYTYDAVTETYTEVDAPDESVLADYYERVTTDKYFFGWYVVDGGINSSAAVGSVGDIVYTWPADPEMVSFEDALSITAGTDAHSPLQVGDKVKWSVNGVSGEAALDAQGTAHVFLAPVFEDYYFISFHLGTRTDDQLKSSILARKLIVLGSDGSVTVRIGNVEAPSTNATRFVFSGWETINGDNTTKTAYTAIAPEGGEIDNHAEFAGVTQSGFYATFHGADFNSDKEVDLYPIFSEARWINFNSGKSGNGASYVGARYRITNDEDRGTYYETFPVSTRPGYKFMGWYADAAVDNDGNITNLEDARPVEIKYFDAAGEEQTVTEERTAHKLVNGDGSLADENYVNTVEGYKRFEVKNGKFYVYTGMERLTLYANWTAEETGYTVLYWLQNANDDDYTLMYYKTMQGVAGQQTAAAATQTTDTAEREVDGVMQTYYPYAEYKLKFAHLSADQDKDKAGDQSGIQQQEIAGDGSTLVNVYYDRNVYKLRFDLGFARRTGTGGSTVIQKEIAPADAASYTTVYGAVGDSLVALTPDGNGGWIYSDSDTNVAYGLVGGKYIPLEPGDVNTTQLYKPEYRFTQTDADGDDLYGVDENGDYALLKGTSTVVPGPTYYVLTSALTAGNEYLIVSRNSAGSGSALGHSGASVSGDAVTVNAGTAATGNAVYIESAGANDTSVWTAEASESYYKFQNNGFYVKGNSNTLSVSTGDSNNIWSWNNSNRIRYRNGSTNGYSIRYNNNNNTWSLSNSSYGAYLYVKTDTSTTSWSYVFDGTGTAYANSLPRYTRATYGGADRYTAAELTDRGGAYYYADTAGTYGAANAYIPAVTAETEVTVNSWTCNGSAYGDTIYMFTPYTGKLYADTTVSGTWQYSISSTTGPNYTANDNWDVFLTDTNHRHDLGTTCPFGATEISGYYDVTVSGTPFMVFYYDITAKYGENIFDRYPGEQSQKTGTNGTAYNFVGWLAQRDSYYNARTNTSIKGYFETMTETLILTGGTIPATDSSNPNVSEDLYTAITVDQDNEYLRGRGIGSEYHGITQEFHCRYRSGSGCNYLYRIYLADVDTLEYPTEPSFKSIVTAGSGSYPNLQTPPTFEGYGDGEGHNTPAEDYELSSTGGRSARTRTYNGKAYAIPELTAAGIASGMIIEFYFLPNEHTLTFKQADSTLIGNATYYYNQSLASADVYSAYAEENTPEGHVFSGWYENPDGVGSKFDFSGTMPDGNIILYAIYTPIRYTIRIDPNGGEIDHINHTYDNSLDDPAKKGYGGFWWNADESNAAAYSSDEFNYRPYATFNRGATYASDGVTIERPADSGYNRSAATSAAVAYGKTLTEYAVVRNYVPLSDAAAEEYKAAGGTVYYYVNTQYDPSIDGEGDGYGNKVGPPADLRNALYLTEDELDQYYLFYSDWTRGNILGKYIIGDITVLGEGAWKNQYHITEQKYRRAFSGEHYEFLGWFEVLYDEEGNEIGVSDMPYNFSDPVTKSFTIRAYWRLDAGYQILYSPEYTMPDGTVINGQMYMDTWTDPAVYGAKYTDGAKTQILQQPTGLTANGQATNDYIFLGWQVVSVDGTPLSGQTLDPGASFTISAADADNSGIIRIQAVYEERDFSHRKPYITNLTLDANGGYVTDGTYYNGDTLVKGAKLADGDNRVLDWNGIGNVRLNADDDTLAFSTTQTETALHLYEYATELKQDVNGADLDPAGKNYFTHPDEHFLLGFDEEYKPDGVTPDKGADYIATYTADGVIAVTRNDDRTLYAVWEPMVYLNLYNETAYTDPDTHVAYPGGPVTFSLSSSSGDTLYIVNEKLGLYDRAAYPAVTGITLAPGESLKLAIPQGTDHDITIEGVNTISGYKVYENSYLYYMQANQTARESGHLKGDASQAGTGYGYEYTLTDTLIVDSSGIDVVFTAVKQDYTLILTDPTNGTGTEEIYFSHEQLEDPNRYALTETRAYTGSIFKGWDENVSADPESPTYPVNGTGITDLKAFFRVGQTGERRTVTLNAIWESNAESTIVDVWKDIPLPGIQTKEFVFTVHLHADITKAGYDTVTLDKWPQFTLSDGQFLRIKSEQHEGDPVIGDNSYIKVTIQKFDRDLDNPVGDPIPYSANATYGGASITNYLVNVTETTSENYTPTVTRTASADQTNYPITVADTPSASWTNANAGGTVVFHNKRKVADVVVQKTMNDPINPNATASFRVEITNADNYVLPAADASFSLGNGGTKVIKDVPVGAWVTVTETKDQDYETSATVKDKTTGAAIYDFDASVYVLKFGVTEGGATAAFVNELKSYPVKIVKVGWNGSSESTNVESQFSLSRGSASIVNKKYTTPTNNVIYDGRLYVADYKLVEDWTDDGYLGLESPIQLKVSGDGSVTVPGYTKRANGSLVDPTGHVVISGSVTSGFLVKVYNVKTVDLRIAKKLSDPLISTARTFYFNVSYDYTLNGVSAGESLSGDDAIAVTSGGSAVVTVPVGATNLRISEDTARLANETDTIAETYDTTRQYNDGAAVNGTEYAYSAAVAESNDGDVITFTNTRKTVNITIRKTVLADAGSAAMTDAYSFSITVRRGAIPITGYTVFDNETATTDDDWVTDAAGSVVVPGGLTFRHGDSRTIRIPVGADVLVKENLTLGQKAADITPFIFMPGHESLSSGDSTEYKLLGPTVDTTLSVYNIPAICKVTDDGGNLLYFHNSADDVFIPAIYGTIHGAFDDVNGGKLYSKTGSGASATYQPYTSITYQVQMLRDYDVPRTDVVTVNAGYDITFTTAATSSADGYPFRRTGQYAGDGASRFTAEQLASSVGKAVLRRVTSSEQQKAFFTVSSADATLDTAFKMSDLIVDGSDAELESNILGGCLTAYKSSVTIEDCLIYRFESDQGGAVYTTGPSLTVTGSTFDTCISKNAGNGNGGGGIRTTATAFLAQDSSFLNCEASFQGGGVYHKPDKTADSSFTMLNCEFTNCHAKASSGGAETTAKATTLTNCTFTNCYISEVSSASRNGGGINIYSNDSANSNAASTATVTNCRFYGCRAFSTNNNYGYGGGLRSTALTTELNGCIFADYTDNSDPDNPIVYHCGASSGGGAALTNPNGMATVKGCTFTNCEATGNGGGLYTALSSLTVDDGSGTQTTVDGCTAKLGGGVYVSSGATFNMKSGTIQDSMATLGGAVFVTGGSVNVSGGTIKDNTATSYGGGAIRVDGGASVTISGTALITGNRAKHVGDGTAYEKCGGAIGIKNGTVTVSGGTISGNWAEGGRNGTRGGAIFVDNGSVLNVTGGSITENYGQTTNNIGAVEGGAVYIKAGGTMNLSGGTISGNTVEEKTAGYAKGAGIYVSERATLNISGSPVFGSGDAANKAPAVGYSDKLNGGASVYTGDMARQDVYIAGYEGDNAASVNVVGNLSSGAGSIWVWAEKDPHYKHEQQFAQFAGAGTSLSTANKESSMKAFRNARHDVETENPVSAETPYLFGVAGTGELIVWGTDVSGSRRVILRKANSTNGLLAGAAFTIWKGETKVKATDIYGNENAESFVSGASGVFFSGVLDYGTYYLQETTAPSGYESNAGNWYCVIVDVNGAHMSGGFKGDDATAKALTAAQKVAQAAAAP